MLRTEDLNEMLNRDSGTRFTITYSDGLAEHYVTTEIAFTAYAVRVDGTAFTLYALKDHVFNQHRTPELLDVNLWEVKDNASHGVMAGFTW